MGSARFSGEARRILRDHEPNCATGRPAAIFRYDEVAATRFGQLVGPRQFRARRGLEARHWWRTGILGVCQAGQGDEKANQEKVFVNDSHLAAPSLWSERPPDDSGSIGRDWQRSIANVGHERRISPFRNRSALLPNRRRLGGRPKLTPSPTSELTRSSNQIARRRICRFEPNMPSQADRSPHSGIS